MILFLSDKDYANVGSRFAQALQTVGEHAEAWYRIPHQFQYPNPGKRYQDLSELPEASTVVFMHSVFQQVPADQYLVFHGGTRYRRNPEKINALFNDCVEMTWTQTTELLNSGAKNEQWVIPPVDVDALQPHFIRHDPVLFGHFPNKPQRKGTETIFTAAQGLDARLRVETERLPWLEHLRRIRAVDVVIESQDYTYDWGMTALEAAAFGKIVITNFARARQYAEEWGTPCPFLVANSPEKLEQRIREVQKMGETPYKALQRRTREWVENYHAMKPIGKYLQSLLLKGGLCD